MAGRPPKPINHLKLSGTYREDRHGERARTQPKYDVEMPDPPQELDSGARAEWDRITPELIASGVIARVDMAVLAMYCQSFSDWQAAQSLLKSQGWWIRGTRGTLVQHPAALKMRDSRRATLRLATEFGLTPSARARVASTTEQELDDFMFGAG